MSGPTLFPLEMVLVPFFVLGALAVMLNRGQNTSRLAIQLALALGIAVMSFFIVSDLMQLLQPETITGGFVPLVAGIVLIGIAVLVGKKYESTNPSVCWGLAFAGLPFTLSGGLQLGILGQNSMQYVLVLVASLVFLVWVGMKRAR